MDRSAGLLEELPEDKKPKKQSKYRDEGIRYPRWYWPSFAAPGIAFVVLLFLVPFYVILCVSMGTVDVFQNPVPVYLPWQWNPANFQQTIGKIFGGFGELAIYGPTFIRTIIYVGISSLACVLIAYPIAYYVARFGGKRRSLLLTLLVAPFFVSYLMRMLAWTNLLSNDGYVNKFLGFFGIDQIAWLEGMGITVIFGLIYGYLPYMILPLYSGLDRINQSLLEASRDLGANSAKTFWKVTLPLSKQAVLAGVVIVMLPMFGDYYTTYLLSNRGRTAMIGTLIDAKINEPGGSADAASLVIILTVALIPFMLYYLHTTRSES